jgi:hypothetical protein
MSVPPFSATFLNRFDVQVDSNHRWDTDRILEVDVYTISVDTDGEISTDSLNPVVSVKIPAQDFCDDRWIDSTEEHEVKALPNHARAAFDAAVMLAKVLQEQPATPFKWPVGATLFATYNRYPVEVIAHATDGSYIVDEANSGVIGVYAESLLEDYDRERWERA